MPHETNPKNCDNHDVLEFKSNLSMAMLGANLLGVLAIAAMVAWGQLKGIPEMEERLTAKIAPLTERVAKLEQWKEGVESRLK